MTEIELIQQIKSKIAELSHARKDVALQLQNLTNAETKLIGLKLESERLIEALRVKQSVTVNRVKTDREVEIEEFKARLPALLDKLNGIVRVEEVVQESEDDINDNW